MKQRIYIDTSVFGGHFDEEFKEHTIPMFKRIKEGEFIILYSTVTQDELENAPEKVKELEKTSHHAEIRTMARFFMLLCAQPHRHHSTMMLLPVISAGTGRPI